jgi:hypothetical protein
LFTRDLEPETRTALLALVKPWRDPRKFPHSYCGIRGLELWGYKPGDEIDLTGFDTAFRRAERLSSVVAGFKLSALLASGDREALGRYLDTLPADVLLDPPLILDSLFYLRHLGREEELELAAGRAEELIHSHVLDSWRRPDDFAAGYAILLAARLGRPDLLPAPWIAHGLDRLPEADDRRSIAAALAFARADWAGLDQIVRLLLDEDPDDTIARELLALALVRQGRATEAIPALRRIVEASPFRRGWQEDYAGMLERIERAERRDGCAGEGAGGWP